MSETERDPIAGLRAIAERLRLSGNDEAAGVLEDALDDLEAIEEDRRASAYEASERS